MTMIVIGISHRSAPFEVLDRVALDEAGVQTLLARTRVSDFVAEAMVLSTCNRIEVYADVDRFHGAVDDVAKALADLSGVNVDDLAGHLYVHYDDRAIHHLFTVASGLDSMILGEQQILGQVRQAFKDAQKVGAVGRTLNTAAQAALRTGKKVHSDTAIDDHGASVVSVALDAAADKLGGLAGANAVIVGAGAMSVLALNYLRSVQPASITVVNRTIATAEKLLADIQGPYRAAHLSELSSALQGADVVVACTGAAGTILDVDHLDASAHMVILDLALPHDVDVNVRRLPGVTLIDLATLASQQHHHAQSESDARDIIDEQTRAFAAMQAAQSVEPLVVSLRSQADGIIDREIERLRSRIDVEDAEFAEVERAMRRAMSTLLHYPTIRMKEMAADPGGEQITEAFRSLFNLENRIGYGAPDA